MTFTRKIRFRPSYNHIRPAPGDNYGIGEMRMWFILGGDKGAVQWMIGTGWYIKSARDHLAKFPPRVHLLPSAWDLGYHAKEPQYEGQSVQDENCPETGGRCFYDGSALNAELLTEGFLAGGDEWVWSRLEAYYRYRFEGAAWPDFTPMYEPHPSERRAAS